MEKEIYKVNPIVIYPKCIIETGVQSDCRTCPERSVCASPRSMCIRPYPGHKDGCPNYGKLPTCPPSIPSMYDQLFDTKNVYAIVNKFNLKDYYAKRRANRPDLPEGQITNSRNWQPITKKENDYAACEFYKENPDKMDYVSTRLLECMGVHVVNTMKEVGLKLKFPVKDYVYRIAFAAKVNKEALEKYGFEVQEYKDKNKKGVKVLIRKKQD